MSNAATPLTDEQKRRKRAFRVAFDLLERQIDRMSAYATTPKYWAQAWADVEAQTAESDDKLLADLLIGCYNELERIWKASHHDQC